MHYLSSYCFGMVRVEGKFSSSLLFMKFLFIFSCVQSQEILRRRAAGWNEKRLRKTLNKCHWSQRSSRNSFLWRGDIEGRLVLDIPLPLSTPWSFLFTTIFTDLTVTGLGMVHVTIPNAIQSGRNAILTCEYELGDDDLYSVKWYKGKREFFRFTPKESTQWVWLTLSRDRFLFSIRSTGNSVDKNLQDTWDTGRCKLMPFIHHTLISLRIPLTRSGHIFMCVRSGDGWPEENFLVVSRRVIWFNPIFMFVLNPLPRKQQIYLGWFVECE